MPRKITSSRARMRETVGRDRDRDRDRVRKILKKYIENGFELRLMLRVCATMKKMHEVRTHVKVPVVAHPGLPKREGEKTFCFKLYIK